MSDQTYPDQSLPPDDAAGKHLILKVPEFGIDPTADPVLGGQPMSTYLRLGHSADDPSREPGADLVALVPQTGPLQNVVGNSNGDGTWPVGQVFDDDVRSRGGCDPHGLDQGTLGNISSYLTQRGGWRDHTDGNRITTTRGDKVEVIRGNYKMVVLGRSDEPTAAAGWDVSGQVMLDYAPGTCPGSSVEVRYNSSLYGGCWEQIDLNLGCVQYSTSVGDVYEWSWGDHQESTTGSETPGVAGTAAVATTPTATSPGLTTTHPNPHIIEKTWATKIESYTGSSALPIPIMIDTTWATTMTSTTNATTISETTNASSTTSTTTVTGGITETTTAASTTSTTTVSGTATENTTVGSASSVMNAGAIAEVTTVGAMTSVTTAATTSELTTVGVATSLTTMGATSAITLGVLKLQIDVVAEALLIVVGLAMNLKASGELNLWLGAKIDINIAAALEISLAKLEMHPGGKIEMAACILHV